jgi:ribosomal protein L37AE/L43A
MGRKKEFKVSKSFTITVKNVAWLEEECHKTDEKASVIMERLINEERRRNEAKKRQNTFYCPRCDDDKQIAIRGFANPIFNCTACGLDLTEDINKARVEQYEERYK